MEALHKEREDAVALRRRGLSYSEIQELISVSQSSLSLWLRNVRLAAEQEQRIRDLSVLGQKDGASKRRDQRLQQIAELQQIVVDTLLALSKDPFFTFGLALYWAEGAKQKEWNVSARVAFINSDPELILLMRVWFVKFFHLTEKDFQYTLFIHATVDNTSSVQQWSEILSVTPERISVVLKHNEIRGRHKQTNYKGLIRLTVRKSAKLNRLISLYQVEVGKALLDT